MAENEVWQDGYEFEVEGKGWDDTESPYDRLPVSAQASVPEAIWGLGKHSAGIAIRFETDAAQVSVRWSLTQAALDMPHMPATGVSGVDLYMKTGRHSWRFAQNGRPTQQNDNLATFSLGANDGAYQEYLLYLPLYNGTKRLEIGVPPETRIRRATTRNRAIVFYGTSIVQGGCASRPGMAHVAILGRKLNRPVLNLGFSGSGRMEPAVAALLAELHPAVYVIDCLWNVSGLPEEEIAERIVTLTQTLRKAHPNVPILFVGQSNIHKEAHPTALSRLQEETVRRMQATGITALFLAPAEKLQGKDDEGTVDGVHPNDLGFMRHADALYPILRRVYTHGAG